MCCVEEEQSQHVCSSEVLGHCELFLHFFPHILGHIWPEKILLQWQLVENEIFLSMTFVEAGVRADLRGCS